MAAAEPALTVRRSFPRPDPAHVQALTGIAVGWVVDAMGRPARSTTASGRSAPRPLHRHGADGAQPGPRQPRRLGGDRHAKRAT